MDDSSESLDPILEAKLIEQEHRIFSVLWNFFVKRSSWEKGDPRRSAAVKAFLWQFISPGSVVAITGGLIAAFSLIVLIWQTQLTEKQTNALDQQTELFNKQNELVKEQNSELRNQIESQNQQYLTNRRTELLQFLYDGEKNTTKFECLEGVFISKNNPKFNERIRAEAFNEIYQIEVKKITDDSLINLERASLDNALIRNKKFKNINLRCSSFDDSFLISTTFSDNTNLAWSTFARANLEGGRFDNQVDLRWANFSASRVSAMLFKNVYIKKANFSLANINSSKFENLDLEGVNFSNSKISRTKFRSSYLGSVDFEGAVIRNGDFTNVKEWKYIKSVSNTKFVGGKFPDGFVEWAKQNGASFE
jgi:uncharacterized protein YjbI with pentapeptide repeats